MIKTLFALSGAVLLLVPALQAQDRHFGGGGPRPAAHANYAGYRHGYGGYGAYRHGNGGRYYYYGGVPYFFPFALDFGYPYYYGAGGGYGDGFGYEPGYGYGPNGAYEGRVANDGADRNAPPSGNEGPSLPQAVQKQLAKKGYYKGSIDGQFGPASRSALDHFQRDHNLRETGRIDEATLDALGFTDHQ